MPRIPPTLVDEQVSSWTTQLGTTKSLGTPLTVQNGDLLLVFGTSEDDGYPLTISSSPSLTWTLQDSLVGVNFCPVYAWTATANATGSQQVSVSKPDAIDSRSFGCLGRAFRGTDGVGGKNHNSNASGAPSVTFTTSAANSSVFCGVGDWAAADGTVRTWLTVNGAPMTESVYFRDSLTYTVYDGRTTDAGPAGSVTLGLSAPGLQKYQIVGIEIMGTDAASPGITTERYM